jgi:hypothetical protein
MGLSIGPRHDARQTADLVDGDDLSVNDLPRLSEGT